MATMMYSLVLAVLIATGVAQESVQSPKSAPEEFSAILSNISNVGGAGITPLKIRINRWTTDADDERLLGVLRDKGQDAFLQALLDNKEVGSISTPTSLKYDFFYARQFVTPQGVRRIMLISDRPMTPTERASSARSREYPFTVIDLRIPKEGVGEGTLAQMVQLKLLGNILGIENLATGPMKLAEVKPVSIKK
jgi:hypothetical protein